MTELVKEHFKLDAPDDWQLACTLFSNTNTEAEGPVILLSSAAGVPRQYYENFASHLIEDSATAVLSYDYRGMADSAGDRTRWPKLRMFHWAILDFPACVDYLRKRFPDRKLVGVGHSFGGQALGLSGVSHHFDRYATVATMSGYWRNLDTPYSVWFQTQVLGRLFAKLLGYIPAAFSPGPTFPGPIMLDWANWINSADYWFDAPSVNGLDNFPKVTLPYLSIGVSDDPWGTPVAVDSFMKHYENADLQQVWVSPADSGPIGHLGFFRKRHAQTHWTGITNYLINDIRMDAGS